MRRLLPLALIALRAAPLAAQDRAVLDSVMQPIGRLFDGMRAHDSTLVRSAFIPGAQMMGPLPRTGLPVTVGFSSVDGFVSAAGRPGPTWDEQIYDPRVELDGNLATVWVFYTFHVGTDFLHCGVDAFHLVRTTAGWRISLVADTRRTTGCETEGKRKA